MKKVFFLFLFICPTFLFAQLELGMRFGLNLAEADLRNTDGDLIEAARRNGVNVGVFANFQLGNIIAFQPEVTFSQKGFKPSFTNIDSASTVSTDYVDMPLMMEAGFKVGNRGRFFVNAGPNVSYLIKAEQEFYNGTNGETITTPFDFDDDEIERLDFGVNFGGGFSVRARKWKYTLDVRYNMGLKEILTVDSAYDFADKAKHRVTNITLGVSYFVFGNKDKMLDAATKGGNSYY